jgi:hypothetical protein
MPENSLRQIKTTPEAITKASRHFTEMSTTKFKITPTLKINQKIPGILAPLIQRQFTHTSVARLEFIETPQLPLTQIQPIKQFLNCR